jgi:hypothetical protein
MHPRSKFSSSPWLTGILCILIGYALVADYRVLAKKGREWDEADKRLKAESESKALCRAVAEYYVDFPDSDTITNDGEWMQKLSGKNAKSIRYLKIEKFIRDPAGRLLDPFDGNPYGIKTNGAEFVVQSSSYVQWDGVRGRSDDSP